MGRTDAGQHTGGHAIGDAADGARDAGQRLAAQGRHARHLAAQRAQPTGIPALSATVWRFLVSPGAYWATCRSPRTTGAAVGSGRTKGSFTQYGIAESVRGSLADRQTRPICTARVANGALSSGRGTSTSVPISCSRASAPQSPPFLEILRAEGITVSVDPNWDPSGAWYGGLQSLLEQVDVFFPNAAEARAFTGWSARRMRLSGGRKRRP